MRKTLILALAASVALPLAGVPAASASGDTHVAGWGWNIYQEASPPSDLTDATAIAAAGHFSLALRSNGTVVGWGSNDYGQLDVPAGLTDAVAISAGWYHGLAIRDDDSVAAWGSNGFGQADVPEGLTAVAISSLWGHNLALRTDGTVAAWGWDNYGQATPPDGLSDVVAVAAGGHHSLALRNDGTVVAWGWNSDGQTDVPEGLNDAVGIAAGLYHSLALRADGTVVAWGIGQYGDPPAGLTGVEAIEAGAFHSLAILGDGSLEAWGNDVHGQTDVPADLGEVLAVDGGAGHTLALVRVGPANQPPTVTVGSDSVVVPEGTVATNGGVVVDPDGDAVTLTASVGVVVDNLDGTWSWSFPTNDGPTQSQLVTITADDGNGGSTAATFMLTVDNVPPTIDALLGPTEPVPLTAQPVTMTVHFSDPGTADTHDVTWDWGDGSTPDVVTGATSPAAHGHTYAEAGVYQVTVTVTDDDGGSDVAESTFLVVYDAEGSKFHGNGKHDLGTDVLDFGFELKPTDSPPYVKGGFRFDLKPAGGGPKTTFKDTAMTALYFFSDWAWASGTGVWSNGSGDLDVEFIVSGFDGLATGEDDTVRIKIWRLGQPALVLFDTQPGDGNFAFPTLVPDQGQIMIKKA